MTDQKATLRSVFAKSTPELRSASRSEGPDLQNRIAREFKDSKWPAKAPNVMSQASELLDFPLSDLLVAGWGKSKEILSALKESEDSPGESTDVWLVEHTFESTLHPYFELRINGVSQPKRIEFTIEMSCTLKGIALRILDGRVVRILDGTGEFKGALKYQELTLFETPDGIAESIYLGASA